MKIRKEYVMSRTIELLKQYKELMDQGIITEEEFEAKKAMLLAQNDFREEKKAEQSAGAAGAPHGQGPAGQIYTVPPQAPPVPPATNDTGSIGWGVLSAVFPIVGLILFIVWNSSRPKNAKVAGIGALVGVVVGIILYICLISFVVSNLNTMGDFYYDYDMHEIL